MQNAKDTFYEMLRHRLAALNPGRTIVVRGITRPGVLVEENELATSFRMPDCFRLRWVQAVTDAKGELPLTTLTCAIDYETAGTPGSGGMDRGRALAAMDGELLAALNQWPHRLQKYNYTTLGNGAPPTAMATQVWWGEPVFAADEIRQDRVVRSATVAVMSYQEAGEL